MEVPRRCYALLWPRVSFTSCASPPARGSGSAVCMHGTFWRCWCGARLRLLLHAMVRRLRKETCDEIAVSGREVIRDSGCRRVVTVSTSRSCDCMVRTDSLHSDGSRECIMDCAAVSCSHVSAFGGPILSRRRMIGNVGWVRSST